MAGKGGARPGAGAKPLAFKAGLKQSLEGVFGEEERTQGWKKLVAMMDHEDPKVAIAAIKMLCEYAFGKPQEYKEVSGADGAALSITVRYADEV